MRIGCLIPLMSVGLIAMGGQSLYTGLTNRKPTKVEITSLEKAKPDAKWLEIKGGELDLLNSGYVSSFGVGDASSIHVPLVPPGVDSMESKIHVLVETKDPALLKFANQLKDLDKKGDELAAMKFLAENREKLRVSRTVTGLVKYGVDSSKEEDKIKRLYKNLVPDVVLLEEGKRPDLGEGAFMLIAGLVIGVVFVAYSGKTKKSVAPPPLPQAAGQ